MISDMRMITHVLGHLTALLVGIGAAIAACQPGDIGTIGFAGTTLPPYNPFTAYPPRTMTVTISSSVACSVELAFQTTGFPPRLTGPGSLNYDILASAGGSSLVYQAGQPSATALIDVGSGNPGSSSFQVTVPQGQIAADGNYADPTLVANVFDRSGSNLSLLKSVPVPLTASVVRACQFAASTPTTMNFTPAIHNGLPNPGYMQSVVFADLSCTAPATVRLSANPMQLTSAPAPSPSFDSEIHVRASATLMGATAVLDTSAGTSATSAARHVVSGATTNGSVRLDVNLLRNRPLLPGTYSSTLTLSIDPNP